LSVAWWIWLLFLAFILFLLAVDLLFFHREAHEVGIKEAAVWSAVWVALGLGFCGMIWWWQGGVAAGEYLAGYLLEKSLSVDNIFVFALLFTYFAVPSKYQHRLLFWGVLGALVFRGIFIFAGTSLLQYFHWMFYVFGAFLVYTAVKMARAGDQQVEPEHNLLLRGFRRLVPMTADYRGQRFLVREAGRWLATPMLAVLLVVESTDILFAVDSIPAVFGVTHEPFLVFTSNIFAILGLRTLYFLLAGLMRQMRYLKTGLAVVLGFVGVKMLVSSFIVIPVWVSLVVIAVTLGAAVLLSLRATRRETAAPTTGAAGEERDPESPGS
jgi:tellurite resistance protein TerC